MLDVSEEVKDLYLTDNTPVEISLTIGNTTYGSRDLVAGTVSITESICSLETFTLSTVEKNELTFSLFNENQTIKELVGKTVTATHILTLEDESKEYIPLGTYTIVDAVKDGDYIIACTCYDTMLAFDKIIDDWWNNRVQFPISIRSLVISLFNEVGVQYTLPNTFTNEEFIISVKPTFFENVKASEVLSYIQEVVGGFFKADRFGVVRLLSAKKLGVLGLVPKIGLYPRVGLHPSTSGTIGFGEDAEVQDYAYRHIFGDLTIGDYAVSRISAVQIRGTEDDVGVIVGSGEDAYIIEGNPLLFNITDTTGRAVAEKLFEILREIIYVPFSGEFKALPFLEVGDCAYIITYVGNVVKSPILYRVMSSQKLSVDSFTTKGTKHRQLKHAVNRMLSTVNQKTHEVINTVDELRSTVTSVEDRVNEHTTEIEQNANIISLSAQRTGMFNLLTNSDFSDQTDRTRGWTSSVGATVVQVEAEYVYDEQFKGASLDYNGIENGYCLKLSPNVTTNCSYYQEINYSGQITARLAGEVTYRVLNADSASIQLFLRVYEGNTSILYVYVGSAFLTNGRLYNIRWLLSDTYLSRLAGKNITKIQYGVFITNGTPATQVEVNHFMLTFSDDTLPFYAWNNYASKNLISQINVEPTGITIQGEKIDIKGITTFSSGSSGTTVIDGGTVNVQNLNASNITSGTMSANKISGGTLTLGGSNNTNGQLSVKNASGTVIGTWNNAGISITGGTINSPTINSGNMYWYKGTANEAHLYDASITYAGSTYSGVELKSNLVNITSPNGVVWMHATNGGIIIDDSQVLQVAAKVQYDNSSPSDVRSWTVTWRQVALAGGSWAWALCQKDSRYP